MVEIGMDASNAEADGLVGVLEVERKNRRLGLGLGLGTEWGARE